jgi:hypothetical protein
LIVGAIVAPSRGSAAPVPVTSRITAVAVYPDRAVLTRLGRVELPAGDSELILDGLPAALVDESLQVSGRGTAAATILDVNLRRTFLETSPDPRLRALEEELANLQREDEALVARLKQLDEQRSLLQRIEAALTATPTKDSPTARPSLDEWQRLLAFQAENLTSSRSNCSAPPSPPRSPRSRPSSTRSGAAPRNAVARRLLRSASVPPTPERSN